MTTLKRLDQALVERGLAGSRTRAAKLILAGSVFVNGLKILKNAALVSETDQLEITETSHYVSRAAEKLLAGLDSFELELHQKTCLDVGASTGGFSQVLLERGAKRVVAIDVGHGQLAASLEKEAALNYFEGVNARFLTKELLTSLVGAELSYDFVVADVSFISLEQVLPAVIQTVGLNAEYLLLVKPQFEVGREQVQHGLVKSEKLRFQALNKIIECGRNLGLNQARWTSSPLLGQEGNQEYLLYLTASN